MIKTDSGRCGILVVDKPAGFTSFDVVAKLRGICETRRIGHGGTLDPMATGVLPVFIGSAAKAVDMQLRQDKTYVATLLFGTRTDTGDVTGTVLEQTDNFTITRGQLERLLAGFVGEITQVPPMYSAVKINGKPLYKYAREGKQVERRPRTVTIHSIDYLGSESAARHTIKVHCSKGTYIRTLAEDIGAQLGLPATLAALRRTTAGMFEEAQALTLEQIQQAKQEGVLDALLLDVGQVFNGLPKLAITPEAYARLRNGAVAYGVTGIPGRCALYEGGTFVGVGNLLPTGALELEKLFRL